MIVAPPVGLVALLLVGLTARPALASVTTPYSCAASYTLQLAFLPSTTTTGKLATCLDGTPQGIFIDGPDPQVAPAKSKFIIWLGDGILCSGQTCEDACALSTTDPTSVCYTIPRDLGQLITVNGGVNTTVAQCYFARVQCSSSFLVRCLR